MSRHSYHASPHRHITPSNLPWLQYMLDKNVVLYLDLLASFLASGRSALNTCTSEVSFHQWMLSAHVGVDRALLGGRPEVGERVE